MSYKPHFRRFLEAAPSRLHFAAHSHHLWPDVSFDAHVQAWLDAARYVDRKWNKVLDEVLPRAQRGVARMLGLSNGNGLAFNSNTHGLFLRVLSCLPLGKRPLTVLTTDAEFHSFSRQVARFEEDGELVVTRIPAEPFGTFAARFAEAAASQSWDMVYVSHVFFSSGFVVPDLERIVAGVKSPETFVVIDGYHAFAALPVDLSPIENRVFYLGGGYKYAMSGEGCCFLHAPPGYGARPRDTGWYAAFGALEKTQEKGKVPYAEGGGRFSGATFDPTALYRMAAVLEWMDAQGITPAVVHAHAHRLQSRFVYELEGAGLPLSSKELVVPLVEARRGQFLTFQTPRAADLHARLLSCDVVTDVRGDRLRFGFGIYHDESDVAQLVARMKTCLG